MAEIIPTINEEVFDDVARKIKIIEPYTEWVKIDVADGIFTPNTLWHNAEDLLAFKTNLNIEIHLMVSDVDTRLTEWLIEPVKRIVFHLEAAQDPLVVLEKIKEAGKEVGIAILPETDWRATEPFWDPQASGTDFIMFLTVSPGFAGQAMRPNTIEKVKGLHEACLECIIEIDGGVNRDNIHHLIEAGATRFAVASAIFGKSDIKKAIEELQKAVK